MRIGKLSDMPVSELLTLYADILRELVKREIVRSNNNPVGGLAELRVVRALGLESNPNSTKGCDAICPKTARKYEIKARRITADNPSRRLSAIRDLDGCHFDYLAGVLFDENFRILRAALLPFDVVKQHSRHDFHVNAAIVDLRDDLWKVEGVVDISDKLRTALLELDHVIRGEPATGN
jgi:hypothetical protein